MNNIPNKTETIRPNDTPCLNNDIRRNIRQRTKLHKHAKLNTDAAWQKFRNKRNEVTEQIRKCKTEYQTKLIEQINDQNTSPKKLVQICKIFNTKTNIP